MTAKNQSYMQGVTVMKKSLIFSAAVATVLLVGCGGGGGGGSSVSGTSSSSTSSVASSSSSSSSSSTGSSSSSGNKISKLTVKSANDLRGYTLESNVAKVGPVSAQTVITIACDGKFTYHNENTYKGGGSITEANGDTVMISMDSIELVGKVTRDDLGNSNVGDGFDQYFYDLSTNELVAGSTCLYTYSSGSGASCPNNAYLGQIIRSKVCN